MKDIGDRMKKNYEDRSCMKLTRRTPVILRLDGKAFHTLTRNFNKPFDHEFIGIMQEVSLALCQNIQGARMSYTQSDEISILLTDFDTFHTEAWFDYNVQKMVSVAASLASVLFNKLIYAKLAVLYPEGAFIPMPVFDCRAFNVSREDVQNYFVWRQKDWIRNSLHMFARGYYTPREMLGKCTSDIHDMLYDADVNWAHLESHLKNGTLYMLNKTTMEWCKTTNLELTDVPGEVEKLYFENIEE